MARHSCQGYTAERWPTTSDRGGERKCVESVLCSRKESAHGQVSLRLVPILKYPGI
ncbi:MAG TPA: hypothetical protein PLN56_10025 [Methanoregulaceae archaeon]|nr:MAG: hypothetical protein IPI71_00535 [Methanolinea sp.]HON82410.1 hypothetical protein [Methanoregulaceae archaeon]HPD11313.1 hypothetical protein [Methanoregulaceae archaeon]HRT16195.1 hypothetical protein [Methanoregulaceae archaeon]HRU31748.1 hypothetical protein [Methanoregulaceae archaeon]